MSDILLKFMLLTVAIVAIHTLGALAGFSFTRVLRHPTVSRLVNLGLASLLVLLVLGDIL